MFEQSIPLVEQMASLGLSDEFIAETLKASVGDLRAELGERLDKVRLNTVLDVLKVFREMALSKKSWAATKFWIETHCMHFFDKRQALPLRNRHLSISKSTATTANRITLTKVRRADLAVSARTRSKPVYSANSQSPR